MYKTNIRTQFEKDWLGKGITDVIVQHPMKTVVLSGVREQENHDYFYDHGATLTVISLWAPENERFARVKGLGKVKTYEDFVKQGANEMSIGLDKLLKEYPDTVANAGREVKETLEEICVLLSSHQLVT